MSAPQLIHNITEYRGCNLGNVRLAVKLVINQNTRNLLFFRIFNELAKIYISFFHYYCWIKHSIKNVALKVFTKI